MKKSIPNSKGKPLKSIILILPVIFLSLKMAYAQAVVEHLPLQGPYLGQKPPNLIPELFAPGIVSVDGRYEHGISFSPELDEVFFSANFEDDIPHIYYSKLQDKGWSKPQQVNFTQGKKEAEMHPFVSFSDTKIYFTAHNPDYTDTKIWYVDRLEDSWSDAVKLDSPLNDDEVLYSNQSINGDFFYTNVSKRKMYHAPQENDTFPEALELDIAFGVHGFISPNQDFIVVNARNAEDPNRKDNDIYVCFKQDNGTWTSPINLGDAVNSHFNETCPVITPDGNYLFFGRYNEEGGLSNFYWVSTKVIHNVRPKI